MTEDLEMRRVRANEARQLLDNPHFKSAFTEVESHLRQVALSCEPDNKEKAQRVVISFQLLEALKREIERKVQDGEMATIQLAELDPQRKRGILRQLVR